MVFKLLIKPIVFFDLEEAVDYYEKKVNGLGRRFYNQFLASIEDIQDKPFTILTLSTLLGGVKF